MRKSIRVSRHTTRALAKNDYTIGIPTKIGNVVVDPVHSSVDIQKPEVLRSGTRVHKLRRVWLAKYVQPIIECNHSNVIIVANDKLAVVCRYITLPKKSSTNTDCHYISVIYLQYQKQNRHRKSKP